MNFYYFSFPRSRRTKWATRNGRTKWSYTKWASHEVGLPRSGLREVVLPKRNSTKWALVIGCYLLQFRKIFRQIYFEKCRKIQNVSIFCIIFYNLIENLQLNYKIFSQFPTIFHFLHFFNSFFYWSFFWIFIWFRWIFNWIFLLKILLKKFFLDFCCEHFELNVWKLYLYLFRLVLFLGLISFINCK